MLVLAVGSQLLARRLRRVVVFHGVKTGWDPGGYLLDLGAGALVGAVGAVVLQLLLHKLHREAPRQAVPATLMLVVAAVVAADLLRKDAGFAAAVLMGIVLGNQRRIDVSLTLVVAFTLGLMTLRNGHGWIRDLLPVLWIFGAFMRPSTAQVV